MWGRVTERIEGAQAYFILPNSEYAKFILRSQNVGAKFYVLKGNSPDHRIRSLNLCLVVKEVKLFRQLGGWLRSSHPLKKA